jgi:two-component system, chemotaxis family, protein-glutamate methylesterase/glutaminase
VIHVLVTDDSATARELIVSILRSDPEIEVIGQAADGAEAVELVQQLAPDVITMDINMPRMDGYEATKAIMALRPTPIVVLTSLSNEEIVHSGLDILLVGAMEIVQKPNALSEEGYRTIAEDLLMKVKAVSQITLAL